MNLSIVILEQKLMSNNLINKNMSKEPKVVGNVTLTVDELDSLRNQIKSLTDENSKMKQGQIKLIIAEEVIDYSYRLREAPVGYPITGRTGTKLVIVKEDFINLSDVEQVFERRAEEKVASNIHRLTSINQKLTSDMISLQEATKKEVANLKKKHFDEVNKLKDEINTLKLKIEGKKVISELETLKLNFEDANKTITELAKDVYTYRNKIAIHNSLPWYRRIKRVK